MKKTREYYVKWKIEQGNGNHGYENYLKERFVSAAIKEMERPWKIRIEKLKAYPPFYLN